MRPINNPPLEVRTFRGVYAKICEYLLKIVINRKTQDKMQKWASLQKFLQGCWEPKLL